MNNLQNKRNILCIDLKSFFASVECVERGFDPYTTPLVVCDPTREGSVTLAVTPYMKKLGVKSRCRVFEIPKNIKYLKVSPRMKLYQQKSTEVIEIYLSYIAKEDLLVYSIDECFLDVTDYLKLYKKNEYELAKEIMDTIYKKTGLTATAGIGPNMLLAKVSMDIEAKHTKDNIALWTYDDIKTKLWKITPLSKMWGIGPRMEAHLNELGYTNIGQIASSDISFLKKRFGIMGEELWQHANGIDLSRVKDFNKIVPKEKSFSHSQVLFKDYYDFNIPIIIYEMLDVLCRRLRDSKMLCGLIGFGISYSHKVGGGFYHSIKLETTTNDQNKLYDVCMHIFDKYYNLEPIRKVSISFGKLTKNDQVQLNLFENFNEVIKKDTLSSTIDMINDKYGKNSLLNASSLLEDSTIRERNGKIGGHHE